MAYVKTNWKDRVVERPNTYTMTDNGNGTVTLTPVPGQIIERGTPLNAENLNKIEDAIVETNTQLSQVKNSHLNYSVKDFGAVGDGETDDTRALQLAFDTLQTGDSLFFPTGTYKVTDSITLRKGKDFIKIYGNDKSDMKSSIKLSSVISNKPVFVTNGCEINFDSLYFEGTKVNEKNPTTWSNGVCCYPTNEYGDTDITFNNCGFKYLADCIDFTGRGLKVTDCEFAEIYNGARLKHYNNDETNNQPIYEWQTNKRGFRKFSFTNNVYHVIMGYCVSCIDSGDGNEQYIHQVNFTGNRMDGSGGVWEGFIANGVISANTIGKCQKASTLINYRVFDIYQMVNVNITGNYFAGEKDNETILDKPATQISDILFARSAIPNSNVEPKFENVVVDGNVFVNLARTIANINPESDSFIFTNNIVDGYLLDSTSQTDSAFLFASKSKNLNISGNVFKGNKSQRDLLIKGSTLSTNFIIRDNQYDDNITKLHDLLTYNSFINNQYHGFLGKGDDYTLSCSRQVDYVIVTNYSTATSLLKRQGTNDGNDFITIDNNVVTVKGSYATDGVRFSIMAYFV